MRIRDLDYKTEFYWKGDRYRQFIRPKIQPKHAYKIPCYKVKEQDCHIDMPSNRIVKPVLKFPIENKHKPF